MPPLRPFLLSFSSRAVRTHWGHLVRTGVVKRDYRDVSVNNVITLGTRIRITILRVGPATHFYSSVSGIPDPADILCLMPYVCQLNNFALPGHCWRLQEAPPQRLRRCEPVSTPPTTVGPWADDPSTHRVFVRRCRLLPCLASAHAGVPKVHTLFPDWNFICP